MLLRRETEKDCHEQRTPNSVLDHTLWTKKDIAIFLSYITIRDTHRAGGKFSGWVAKCLSAVRGRRSEAQSKVHDFNLYSTVTIW